MHNDGGVVTLAPLSTLLYTACLAQETVVHPRHNLRGDIHRLILHTLQATGRLLKNCKLLILKIMGRRVASHNALLLLAKAYLAELLTRSEAKREN